MNTNAPYDLWALKGKDPLLKGDEALTGKLSHQRKKVGGKATPQALLECSYLLVAGFPPFPFGFLLGAKNLRGAVGLLLAPLVFYLAFLGVLVVLAGVAPDEIMKTPVIDFQT